MLTGFNTNVRRHGLLFHVQTEDSGRAHPHVITHLFHQGTIVATEKQSYEDQLDSQDLEAEVRRRMQRQHKGMLIRLRDGELDARIRERLGPDVLPGPQAPAAPERQDEAVAPVPAAAAAPVAPEPAPEPAGPAAGAQPPPRAAAAAPSTVIASGVERSLEDELILEYLVEKARERSTR